MPTGTHATPHASGSQTPHPDEVSPFGFEQVPTSAKQARVDAVFDTVAARYDLMNDLMSFGLHREWKTIFASLVKPARHRPSRHIDVAGGTGDIAARIRAAGTPATQIVVADINEDMLRAGVSRDGGAALERVTANAEALPFAQRSFETYTIAFGIRNVPRIDEALREAYRVLDYGGRFLCLEFSTVDVPVLARLYDAYSFKVLPAVGRRVTGSADAYRYLAESIRTFPDPDAFAARIADAGFARTSVRRLSGGIVAIHSGWKL